VCRVRVFQLSSIPVSVNISNCLPSFNLECNRCHNPGSVPQLVTSLVSLLIYCGIYCGKFEPQFQFLLLGQDDQLKRT